MLPKNLILALALVAPMVTAMPADLPTEDDSIEVDFPEQDFNSTLIDGDRALAGGTQWNCKKYPFPALTYQTKIFVTRLKKRKGKHTIRAGPGVCDKIICGNYVAIWYCNDTDKEQKRSYKDIGRQVEMLVKNCARDDSDYISGEYLDVQFEPEWKVTQAIKVLGDSTSKCLPAPRPME
ncbi:hypothetical protein BJY04DRAFT_176389 [Aspergillus karnatakaensis]|uniref:uncharacterized protein n=1 Tax=Aspergillus karnatakaensis TaxID=1810916 RepID=UPI003CCD2F11